MRSREPAGLSNLLHLGGIAVLFIVIMLSAASAHVTLTPTNAIPGSHISIHFRVGHGWLPGYPPSL